MKPSVSCTIALVCKYLFVISAAMFLIIGAAVASPLAGMLVGIFVFVISLKLCDIANNEYKEKKRYLLTRHEWY